MSEPVADDDGWIKHNGGPCPIPDAKAGEYALLWHGHITCTYQVDARELGWEDFSGHYRLHKPAPSDTDVLRQAGESLRRFVGATMALSSVDQVIALKYESGNQFGMIHSSAFLDARAVLALIDARLKS